jgi:hypothetical protein
MAVLLPQNMLDLEVVQLRNTALGLLVEGAEFGAVHAILALDLLDHQFRVGDDPQTLVALGNGKFQRRQKAEYSAKLLVCAPRYWLNSAKTLPAESWI